MNALRGLFLMAAGIVLAIAVPGLTQDAPPKVLFEKSGELTEKDSLDKIVKKSFSVGFEFKMKADETYRIDASSSDVDTIVRVENEAGKTLALDDDGAGDGFNSRLIFRAPTDGEYRLVVTTAIANQTGKFKLVVSEATKADIFKFRTQNYRRLSGDERSQILDEVLAHLEERGKKTSLDDGRMTLSLTYDMESTKTRGLTDWVKKFSKALAESDDDEVKAMSRVLEGVARRVRLMGNKMDITGTLLDGSKINWDSYRGKVVLVDFWATWCGPCIKELPNVQKMYAAYKDRGFDVVGISLDRDVDKLVSFVERRKLPWVCIYEKGQKHQPMVDHYGVLAIPVAILVDKQGRVISMDARGEQLGRLLEEQLGPIDEEKK